METFWTPAAHRREPSPPDESSVSSRWPSRKDRKKLLDALIRARNGGGAAVLDAAQPIGAEARGVEIKPMDFVVKSCEETANLGKVCTCDGASGGVRSPVVCNFMPSDLKNGTCQGPEQETRHGCVLLREPQAWPLLEALTGLVSCRR